jgi:hypothetical protein
VLQDFQLQSSQRFGRPRHGSRFPDDSIGFAGDYTGRQFSVDYDSSQRDAVKNFALGHSTTSPRTNWEGEPAPEAATLYTALGIEPATEIHDLVGRPLVLNRGDVVDALYMGRES